MMYMRPVHSCTCIQPVYLGIVIWAQLSGHSQYTASVSGYSLTERRRTKHAHNVHIHYQNKTLTRIAVMFTQIAITCTKIATSAGKKAKHVSSRPAGRRRLMHAHNVDIHCRKESEARELKASRPTENKVRTGTSRLWRRRIAAAVLIVTGQTQTQMCVFLSLT